MHAHTRSKAPAGRATEKQTFKKRGNGDRMRSSDATVMYGSEPAAGHHFATLLYSNSTPESGGVKMRAPARVLWIKARF